MTTRFLRAARIDIQEAENWYEEQRPGLGELFWASLNETLDSIESNSNLYPRILGTLRKARLARPFPHLIFYRVLDGGDLEIVAVFHPARNPKIWQRR